MNSSLLRSIRREDVPPEYRDLADALGMKALLRLIRLWGGQSLYIPKPESLAREARDREIRAGFDGKNARALAARFGLSQRQVRKIINGRRS